MNRPVLKKALLLCADESRGKKKESYIDITNLCEDAEIEITKLEEGYEVIKSKLLEEGLSDKKRIESALNLIDRLL